MAVAYIGLGSNLEQPVRQIQTALAELAELPETRLRRASGLYSSAPMGPQDQPDYVNAVAELETGLSPESLLNELQRLENEHRRKRLQHWGPRTLDLDILLYDQLQIDTPDLTVPHPGLRARNFVLIPLYEIAPDLILPDNHPLAELAADCSKSGLQRLVQA